MKIIKGRVRLAASDVANFLACRRLTQLDLLRARGELRPPREFDIGFQDLVRRGEVHERAVLERFRADGLDVVDVSGAMGRFATREDEVDGLFRLGVFTDLYRVVRQGVRAGVESYSIKRLEPLCGYGRRVDLAEATASLIALEAALEDGDAAGDGERQRVVAGYNQDDCRASGTDRRAGRAGRAGRRRRGRPGQEVGGATVPLPGAGA